MADEAMQQMMQMWKDQPGTARAMFPAGMAYLNQEGDSLQKLADQFGLEWEDIADATMGTHEPKEINEWLSNNGGKKLKSGYWAFSEGQQIMIPPPPEGAQEEIDNAAHMAQMMEMWKSQPDTVRAMFPAGMAYLNQEGDSLQKLADSFGIEWEAIADATMGTHEPKAINDWLENNGGKKLSSGYWAFSEGQQIMIPPPPASVGVA